MSGHNKWSTIKHRKGAQDARRAQRFSQLSRELMVAVRAGGPEEAQNPRLRTAMQRARGQNMPNAKIKHAIQRALGLHGEASRSLLFAGYSVDGVGILVAAETDSRNRTVSFVRSVFRRHGGSLGQDGCLQFAFTQEGRFTIDRQGEDADDLLLSLIELGIEDGWSEGDALVVSVSAASYGAVRDALRERGLAVSSSALVYRPCVQHPLAASRWPALASLLAALRESDDVCHTYHNAKKTS